MSEKKWYEVAPLSGLIEVLTERLHRSELNDVVDNSLVIMRDHLLRNSTLDPALKDLEETARKVIVLRKKLYGCISETEVSTELPVISDVTEMATIEEVKAFKKKLSQLTGACDKRIAEEKGGG